jgi:hypothetical protein
METDEPCPYCKRIHYSSYTAERCAARHEVTSAFRQYKRKKEKPAKTAVAVSAQEDLAT